MKNNAIKLGCVFLLSQFSALTSAASFNCEKASTFVEKTICKTPNLSILDDEISLAYKEALLRAKNKNDLTQKQLNWLRDVRNKCKESYCLSEVYSKQIGVLISYDESSANINFPIGSAREKMLNPWWSTKFNETLGIKINKETISSNGCSGYAKYSVVKNFEGSEFKDGSPVAGSPGVFWSVITVHIDENLAALSCFSPYPYIQFTFTSDTNGSAGIETYESYEKRAQGYYNSGSFGNVLMP